MVPKNSSGASFVVRRAGPMDFSRIASPSTSTYRDAADIALGEISIDVADQSLNRNEATRADYVLDAIATEALDQIKPRGRRRSEMQLEARALREPRLHLWMPVGREIAGDDVDIAALRRLAPDLFQEAQPFNVRVVRFGAQRLSIGL
jgi:hypothetical protein